MFCSVEEKTAFVQRIFQSNTVLLSLIIDNQLGKSFVGENYLSGYIFRRGIYSLWKIFVGENFRHEGKISSLFPDETSPDKVIRVNSLESHIRNIKIILLTIIHEGNIKRKVSRWFVTFLSNRHVQWCFKLRSLAAWCVTFLSYPHVQWCFKLAIYLKNIETF